MSSSPQTPATEQLLVYTDEDIDFPLVRARRTRGFDVLTAQEAGTLGQTDEQQLAFALSIGRVIVSYNRSDFRALHDRLVRSRRQHSGVLLLPQDSPLERRVVRATMLLERFYAMQVDQPQPRLLNWNDVQQWLIVGNRWSSFTEGEVQLAIGR